MESVICIWLGFLLFNKLIKAEMCIKRVKIKWGSVAVAAAVAPKLSQRRLGQSLLVPPQPPPLTLQRNLFCFSAYIQYNKIYHVWVSSCVSSWVLTLNAGIFYYKCLLLTRISSRCKYTYFKSTILWPQQSVSFLCRMYPKWIFKNYSAWCVLCFHMLLCLMAYPI